MGHYASEMFPSKDEIIEGHRKSQAHLLQRHIDLRYALQLAIEALQRREIPSRRERRELVEELLSILNPVDPNIVPLCREYHQGDPCKRCGASTSKLGARK